MKLEQSFEVQAPIDAVWEALIDLERVAPCLPGATITGHDEDGTYHGEFKVKLIGDPILEPLPRRSLLRLRRITAGNGGAGSPSTRADFAAWVSRSIAPRNVAGLADAAKHNLYAADSDLRLTSHHFASGPTVARARKGGAT